MPDLRTASLFGTPRALLLRDAQELPAHAVAALRGELDGTPPDTLVILLAVGTGSLTALSKRIKELGGRIDVAPPREWEEAKWSALVAEEFRRHDRAAEPAAVAALLAAAGTDVSAIAQKAAQVAVVAPPGRITAGQVQAIVTGLGSRGSFAVADAMCERKPDEALRLLRGVLASGDPPVMVLGGLAYRLRTLVAVAGKLEPKSVGLNVSPGQARRLGAVRRNFGPGELTRAFRTLAHADVALKSGDEPAELVIERAVVGIATATTSRG